MEHSGTGWERMELLQDGAQWDRLGWDGAPTGRTIPALLPPTSTELDVPHNVQVAAVVGIGLVYQGTAHRHTAEVLLAEIGRTSMRCGLISVYFPFHTETQCQSLKS